MTLQSSSSNSEIVSASGPSSTTSSTSTSSTDVFPLPYSIGHKEIVLNNEARTVVADVGENNILSTPGANVSIVESSDVHLGNRTNFNGEVTIYQYINGPNIPNGSVGQDEVECKKTVSIKTWENIETNILEKQRASHRKPNLHLLISTISVLYSSISIIVILSPMFLPKIHTSNSIEARISAIDVPASDTPVFIPREMWGGVPPRNTSSYPTKAKLIVVKHTGGPTCNTTEACKDTVRNIQKEHMEIYKFPDISYNFLIGGDGKIYIGRGFYVENEGRKDSMDIAFIGNFSIDVPTAEMIQLGIRVVRKATSPNVSAVDFKTYHVVSHNQTEKTDSPGENLFRAVRKWDFYSRRKYFVESRHQDN